MNRPAPTPARRARPVVALAAALALTGSLGGCGLFSSSDEAAPAAVATAAPTHHPVEFNAYPVTLTHRYGETELSEPPGRIVTLGLHDQDTLISLGLRPVGIREWPGPDRPYSAFRWAPEDFTPDSPPVASPLDEIDFAAVAALDPDLITVVHSDVEEADYHHLTEIAPTLAQPPDVDDFLSSWQEETRLMGRAVGRPEQAEEVISSLEERIAAVRLDYPVLSDADVALVMYSADGTLRLVNPYDPRARLLGALGMRFPDSVVEAVGDEEFDVRTDLDVLAELDYLDVLVWLADPADDPADLADAAEAIVDDPDYADIGAVDRHASVWLSEPEAVSFASGLSLAYAAEADGPALAEALGAKAKTDKRGRSPGPLPGQDPAVDRENAANASASPTSTPTEEPTPSATPAASAEPSGTPTQTPSGEPSTRPGVFGGIFEPDDEPDDEPRDKPAEKRRPKSDRQKPASRHITG